MVRSLRGHVFRSKENGTQRLLEFRGYYNSCSFVFPEYSGALQELHFVVGGFSSEADQVHVADLMKRMSDLFFIGHNYTRVYLTTGAQTLRYAGDVKSISIVYYDKLTIYRS